MILQALIGGIIVGATASLPPGPTWILCFQRNLNKGFRSGLYSGLGSALCDTLYSIIALFSLSIVTSFISANIIPVKIVAGIIVSFFGVNILLKNPDVQLRRNKGGDNSGRWKDTASTFVMVLANPTFILAHITLIATVDSLGLGATEGSFVSILWMVLGVFAGCMAWWTTLAVIVRMIRRKFRPTHILWINRIAGSAITLLGISLIFSALTNIQLS